MGKEHTNTDTKTAMVTNTFQCSLVSAEPTSQITFDARTPYGYDKLTYGLWCDVRCLPRVCTQKLRWQ